MCGIAGFCGDFTDNIQQITRMNQEMLHRGPDAGGYWNDTEAGITLGHRRLAIQDLSENGAQPIQSHSGRYVMSYNGEIYNADVLKQRLLQDKKVTSFRGTSDTEIILEAFEAYGLEAIHDMKGMLALALYDKKLHTLYLMRDRVGEKPLYYGFVKGKFVFASDLASIRVLEGFDNGINREALAALIKYGYIPAPMSIYENIFKLMPGQILSIEAPFQKPVFTTYWSMEEVAIRGEENPFLGTAYEAKEELKRLLKEAVKSQMVADVPLGAYLSGGIDSPLVVSMMQELSQEKIKTFTIGFEDKKYNEAVYAKDIAAHIGTNHTELYVTEKDLQEVIPKLSFLFSEPLADSSQIPTFLVSKLARTQVTVSLSGDAGDELFCGYNTYAKNAALWNKISKVPYPVRDLTGTLLTTLPTRKQNRLFRSGMCMRAKNITELQEAVSYSMYCWQNHMVPGTKIQNRKDQPVLLDEKSSMMYRDMMTYHPDDILAKVDRAGMAVSLENRIPMLDKDVVEFAWRIPMGYKYQNGDSKHILKDILYDYVPKELLDRPKKGFSVPMKKWLSEGSVKEWASEMLNHNKLAADGYLNKQYVDALWNKFQTTRENEGQLWKILMAEQWYRDCYMQS